MLDKINVERSVQRASTSFNIFENKGNIWMLNESLNQFKFDSTHFQQAVNTFHTVNNVKGPVQTPPTSGECMLNCLKRRRNIWEAFDGDIIPIKSLPSYITCT